MRKKIKFIIAGILLVGTLTSYKLLGKTIVDGQAIIVNLDKNQLVNEATAIVSGKIVSSQVELALGDLPATDFKVKVNKVFKGSPPSEFEVRTNGGENEKTIYIPDEDFVSFKVGEEVILFLTDVKGTRRDRNDFDYFVVGQYQGKFLKDNGKFKNKKFQFDEANFEKELAKIEKDNKINGVKSSAAGPNDNKDI